MLPVGGCRFDFNRNLSISDFFLAGGGGGDLQHSLKLSLRDFFSVTSA